MTSAYSPVYTPAPYYTYNTGSPVTYGVPYTTTSQVINEDVSGLKLVRTYVDGKLATEKTTNA